MRQIIKRILTWLMGMIRQNAHRKTSRPLVKKYRPLVKTSRPLVKTSRPLNLLTSYLFHLPFPIGIAFDFGWVSPNPLPVGEVVLSPSCHSAENYYIAQSGDDGDYYLLENRNSEKWGVGVPGEGLLIFHIHPDIAFSVAY